MKQFQTNIANAIIENTASGRLPGINPHIALQDQLGYYNLAEDGVISVTSMTLSSQIDCVYQGIPQERLREVDVTVFGLFGKQLIVKAKQDLARFFLLFLTPPQTLPVPADQQDLNFIRQQQIALNLVVDRSTLDTWTGAEKVKTKQTKFTVSKAGEDDISILVVIGPKLSGLSYLKQSGFTMTDIINRLYALDMYDILVDGDSSNTLPIQDVRYRSTVDYELMRQDMVAYSNVYEGLSREVFEYLLHPQSAFKGNATTELALSQIDLDYYLLFGIDIAQFLRNESRYFQILDGRGVFRTNPNLLKSIIQQSKIFELKVYRQRVAVKQGRNRLGAPYTDVQPFDATWEDVATEIVALGGTNDAGEFREVEGFSGHINKREIFDNANGRVQYFSVEDKTIRLKTDGYYRYGIEVKMTDAAREYLKTVLQSFRVQKRWFDEYYHMLINSRAFDPLTGFLKPAEVARVKFMYASNPPWVSVIASAQRLVESVIGVRPAVTNLFTAMKTWIRPESVSAGSLGDFRNILNTLESNYVHFLKADNEGYHCFLQDWFHNHLADATFDKTIRLNYGPGGFELKLPDLVAAFPNQVEVKGGLVILPDTVEMGVALPKLIPDGVPEAKHVSSVLMGVVANKVLAPAGGAGYSSAGKMVDPAASTPERVAQTTFFLGNLIGSTKGIQLSEPADPTPPMPPSVDGSDRLVVDDEMDLATGSVQSALASEISRVAAVDLVSAMMGQSVLTPATPLRSQNWRDSIEGSLDTSGLKPGTDVPPEAQGALGGSDFSYEQFVGFQYCNGYNYDGNGDVDVRSRKWFYASREGLQTLADAKGSPLLCRLYNAAQKAKDNGLAIPVRNEYFILIPEGSNT